VTTRKTAIGLLQPQDQPEHLSIVQNLVRAANNLGVVMMRLSERTGTGEAIRGSGVPDRGAETADTLSRDPRPWCEARRRTFLPSTCGDTLPGVGFVPQIYRAIPKDLEALFF